MFCPKCGCQNPEGSRFCAKCGDTLDPAPLKATFEPVESDVAGMDEEAPLKVSVPEAASPRHARESVEQPVAGATAQGARERPVQQKQPLHMQQPQSRPPVQAQQAEPLGFGAQPPLPVPLVSRSRNARRPVEGALAPGQVWAERAPLQPQAARQPIAAEQPRYEQQTAPAQFARQQPTPMSAADVYAQPVPAQMPTAQPQAAPAWVANPQPAQQPAAPLPNPVVGGGGVDSRRLGFSIANLAFGLADVALALVSTFVPWFELSIPWIGPRVFALPSTAMQLLDESSSLRSLAELAGGEVSNDLVLLGFVLMALWLVPLVALSWDVFCDFSGRGGTFAGSLLLACSTIVVYAGMWYATSRANEQAAGFFDVERYIHLTSWVRIILICGLALTCLRVVVMMARRR